MSEHFFIRAKVIFSVLGVSNLRVHPRIETDSCTFALGQTAPLCRAILEKPGDLFDVLLCAAMATAIKTILATQLETIGHCPRINPLHEVMIDCIADQTFAPTLVKPRYKPFGVGLFGISQDHAIAGFDVQDQQHMFALHSDRMNQPLFVRAVQLIILNN